MRQGTGANSVIDLVIVTAIVEEYEAVLELLVDSIEPILPNRHPVPFGWRIGYLASDRHASPYSVAVAICTDQTQVPSSLATYLTVDEFRPRYVLFCGIAGGLNSAQLPAEEQLRLGDILIAGPVWGYEYGKVGNDGSFRPRPDQTYRPDPILKQAAELFGRRDTSWPQAVIEAVRQCGIAPNTLAHSVSGPVASGNKVIDNPDADFFKAVLKSWPKLRGVEMEGAGAASAIELLAARGIHAGFLMVRGISDLPRVAAERVVETSERDLWKRAAAAAVATFVAHFVSKGWPVEPLGELDNDRPRIDGPLDDRFRRRGRPQGATSILGSDERVLFYMADRELHENSGIDWGRGSYTAWAECLRLELRLIFLSMNVDGEIVMPPTYFLETKACRELIETHMLLVEAGYMKLLVNRASLAEYLERKQTRYAKARGFSAYFDAYFSSHSFHGLVDMPFQLTDKIESVGGETLAVWKEALLGRVQRYPRFVSRARRFLDLSSRTERSAILFETIQQNQVAAGLSTEEAYHLDIRSTMNRSYLLSYARLGFTVPERSSLVWPGLTRVLPRSGLDLVAMARLITELRLRSRLVTADTSTLVRWRTNPAVRAFFLAARRLLLDGVSLSVLAGGVGSKAVLSELDAALS